MTPWERAVGGPVPTAVEQAMSPLQGPEANWRYAELCASHAAGVSRADFERVYKALYVNAVHPPDPLTRRLCFVCVSCTKACPEFFCTKCRGFVHGPTVTVPGRLSCGEPEGVGFVCRACMS
jgi:hypothetical protein